MKLKKGCIVARFESVCGALSKVRYTRLTPDRYQVMSIRKTGQCVIRKVGTRTEVLEKKANLLVIGEGKKKTRKQK